jgi:hypothetical protein
LQWPGRRGRPRIAFGPDGRWLVASTAEKALRFWRVGSWKPGRVVPTQEPGPAALAFSRNGTVLAVADFPRGIKLLHPATGKELATLKAPEDNPSTSLSFSTDGSQLAAATNNHTIHLWDLRCLRRQLKVLDLDWDFPPYPPRQPQAGRLPLAVRVLPGKYRQNAFVSLGLLEAENLPVLGKLHAFPRPQPMSYWTRPGRRWSQDWQLFCPCSRTGAYVELEVTVPATAEYRLDVYFTRASDYGTVRVFVDGKPVGGTFAGFYPVVGPAGKVALGRVDLRRGAHRLRFTVVGRSGKATGYNMGIDCLELTPLKKK